LDFEKVKAQKEVKMCALQEISNIAKEQCISVAALSVLKDMIHVLRNVISAI
jgi:hypothetical protein